ncbi:hypothetical protein JCM14635_01850 [Megalodesulfovibrio paquesii]
MIRLAAHIDEHIDLASIARHDSVLAIHPNTSPDTRNGPVTASFRPASGPYQARTSAFLVRVNAPYV